MSTMDPAIIKQWLQLQILGNSPLLSSGRDANNDESKDGFQQLLNSLLAQSTQPLQTEDGMFSGSTNRLTLKSLSVWGTEMTPGNSASWPYGAMTTNDKYAGALAFEPLIQSASRRFGLDSGLLKAVIAAESSFNPNAVSHAGAKGLMQLMDRTGQAMGVTDPFDPAQNIEGGSRYLSRLLMKYNGNEMLALAAYNAGPGRVDRLGASNDAELEQKLDLLPMETQQYVRKVLALKLQYQQ